MVKNYLIRLTAFLATVIILLLPIKLSADSYSELFISISDAKTALKNEEDEKAVELIKSVQVAFSEIKEKETEAGQQVSEVLDDILSDNIIENDELTKLSSALLAFEEEQNPIDLEAEKEKFQQKMTPALERLKTSIEKDSRDEMKTEYLDFNSIWTRNESIVRSTSTAHYGAIETAMSFLRASMESDPLDREVVLQNWQDLDAAFTSFIQGDEVEQNSSVETLSAGIELLEAALEDFQSGNVANGQDKMKTFIQTWPIFEGEVSTRSSSLYTKVESETPVIMARGSEEDYQNRLAVLIEELKSVDTNATYNFLDAMFILLREGVEALLIVLALVGSLRAANQRKGLIWVYAGAALGIVMSFVTAYLLQALFPALSSGTNREILEGFVGLVAVVMMIGIGIWLHSKSSVKSWNAYMKKQMALVMSTGSFISMFGLSFLAVFREGAETILFYVGILPNITPIQLYLGIGLAVLCLILLALALELASHRVPVNLIFKVLTWTIYLLAFKMLGVSLHALQLTSIIPNHLFPWLPTIDWAGIYPSWEVLVLQVVFILVVALGHWIQKCREVSDES